MKRLSWITTVGLGILTATPALAQQGPGSGGVGPMYGYGHMWYGGWGWHAGMMLGPLFAILALVGIVTLFVWLLRGFGMGHGGFHHWHGHGFCPHCGHGRRGGALEILEERFARGEIGKDEFEEKRRLIGR